MMGNGGGPFVLVPGPSREKHLPDSREGLPDSREGGYSSFTSFSKQKTYHFRSKNHIIFEAKTISFSKQKTYHFRSKTISFSKQNHIIFVATSYRSIFTVPYSKGYMSGQSRGLVGDYDSGKGHVILYIVNLAKIMAWLWYEVGQEGGHEFGRD